jgi:hypothetical protein
MECARGWEHPLVEEAMTEEFLKEVFDTIKQARCNRAVYTTHDQGIMLSVKEELLKELKQKWPQEAAMLSTTVVSRDFSGRLTSL